MLGNAVTVASTFQNFDELCGQLRGVDLELIPLRAGPAFGEIKALIGPGFVFTAGRFVSDHRFRGGTHESQVLLGMHFGRNGSAYYESTPGKAGDLTLHQPNSENFGSMGGTYEYGALSIDAAELARLGEGVAGGDTLLKRHTLIRAPGPMSTAACDALERAVKFAFSPGSFATAARVEMLKRTIFYPYLMVAAHGGPEPDERAHESRATTVRRAEAWLDREPPESAHVIDLCRVLGMPLRSVQRAFHETLGIGPAHYLKRYRLHKVRQFLLQCDAAATHVTEVALDHGFWELGRFAAIYKQTYGERPSDTLRRRM